MKSRLILVVMALLAPGLGAQSAAPAPVAPVAAPSPTAEEKAKIDQILAGEEQVLQGLVSSYDAGNRRDPFQSLLAKVPAKPGEKRPDGVAGLLIDEISLRGIFRTSKGYVAQIAAMNKTKSFLLREGEQVFDGDVLRIESHQVVFRQIVNDPTVIKPFREVVKKLHP